MKKTLDQALDDLRSSFSKLEAAIAEQRAGIRRNGYITIPNDPRSRYEVGNCEGEEVIVDDWAYMIGYDAEPTGAWEDAGDILQVRVYEYLIRNLWGCPLASKEMQPIVSVHVDTYDRLIKEVESHFWRWHESGDARRQDRH